MISIIERKRLIAEKFSRLLVPSTPQGNLPEPRLNSLRQKNMAVLLDASLLREQEPL
jgi:hypothetical protein